MGSTKTLPSPMRPVLAALWIASTTSATCSSRTMISTFTFGRRSTTYSAPRYSSVWPFCRPNPFTSHTVMPWTPTSDRLAFTSSSLNGWMMASTFFMGASPTGTQKRARSRCSRAPRSFSSEREVVTLLPVLRDVEALALLIFIDTQAKGRICDLQDEERAGGREQPRNRDRKELIEHLGRVA